MPEKVPDKKDFTLWSIGLLVIGAAVGSGATAMITTRPKHKIGDKNES